MQHILHSSIFKIIFLLLVMSYIVSSGRRLLSTALFLGGRGGKHPIQSMYESLTNLPTSLSPAFYKALEHPLEDRNLAHCLEAMNHIQLADLGFDEDDINGLDESVCATISTTRQFNIAVFLIPKGHGLPLHDHPSMTVLSKVIRGDLEMKSFSIIRNRQHDNMDVVNITGYHKGEPLVKNGAVAAKLTHSTIKTAADLAWYLTPSVDNLHEFRAATNCVVLDCLLPPYSEPERPCNFYRANPPTTANSNEASTESSTLASTQPTWWLVPIPEDSNFLPHTIEYSGIRPQMKTKAKGFSTNNPSS